MEHLFFILFYRTTVKLQYKHWWSFCFFSAFILVKTHRKTSVLLFVDNSRYINDSHYEFGKMFVARITLSHPCLVKIHKMLLSNWRVTLFRGRFSSRFGLWTLAIKQIALRAHATLSEYMQFVHVLENITSCSLFSNCLRPFRNFSHHTVTSNKHPLPLLIEDMQCRAKQSLAVGTCNDFCIFLRWF